MTDSKVTSKLNGSSGFYEENSFERIFLDDSVSELTLQNEKNHGLENLRYELRNRRTSSQAASDSPRGTPRNDSDLDRSERRRVSRPPELEFTPEQLAQAQRSVNYYRQFGDFWNTFPKTDYTYSRQSRWYGDEVAPGIRRIPNMSRRSYRSSQNTSVSVVDTSGNLTPPSSPSSSGNGFFNRSPAHSSAIIQETWFVYIRRIVRTTTTSVFTRLYRPTTVQPTNNHFQSVSGVSGVGRLDASGENPQSRTRWLFWLLMFLLVGTAYYCAFGSDPPIDQLAVYASLTNAPAALCNGVLALCRPFWSIWEFAVYFITLFFNSIILVPSLFVPVNETLTESTEFTQSQKSWLMVAIRDIVESMDPHDFSLSPEDENHLVDRVSDVVNKGLQNELDAMKKDQLTTREQIEQIQLQMGDFKKGLLSALVTIQERIKKMEEANRSSGASAGQKLEVPSDFRSSVMAIVEELLEKYHADRTGKTDYALLSNGGAIASIRCTRPYKERAAEYTVWDIFNWEFINTPDIILKPGIMPGECWAFEGANGYLAIRLSLPIYVEGFTMEHTPRELSPYGHIKSAPRKFSVWGLDSLEDREETFLGRFEFLENGKSLQSYDAVIADRAFHLIELRIESNHGHLEYTCLYRFRVHGRPTA